MRALLPTTVALHELRRDVEVPLFPEEQRAVSQAVEKRRREFVTARECVRRAMAELRVPVSAVPRGDRGQPVWPAGLVGSITHCQGYRAAALARRSDILGVGIDAEPHAALPADVLRLTASPEEMARVDRCAAERPYLHWSRLLFCVKEAVYKIWFPAEASWLGFEDVETDLRSDGTFNADLARSMHLAGVKYDRLGGRWAVVGGIIPVAIAIPAERGEQPAP